MQLFNERRGQIDPGRGAGDRPVVQCIDRADLPAVHALRFEQGDREAAPRRLPGSGQPGDAAAGDHHVPDIAPAPCDHRAPNIMKHVCVAARIVDNAKPDGANMSILASEGDKVSDDSGRNPCETL
jgi:hypothetical protein